MRGLVDHLGPRQMAVGPLRPAANIDFYHVKQNYHPKEPSMFVQYGRMLRMDRGRIYILYMLHANDIMSRHLPEPLRGLYSRQAGDVLPKLGNKLEIGYLRV